MRLCDLSCEILFDYLSVYQKISLDDKKRIKFIVYKNHLMYLKENKKEDFEYYYKYLSKILGNYDFHKNIDNIKIQNMDDLLRIFNSCMKDENDFFENSLLLNSILEKNGLCPLVLYCFNDLHFKAPITMDYLKEIVEFSVMCLYRVVKVPEKKIDNYKLFDSTGAISNIYIDNNQVIKYPKTLGSYLFLMDGEWEVYEYLKDTPLKKFLADNYQYNHDEKILKHDFVNGKNGEYYLFKNIPITNDQIESLREFYTIYRKLRNDLILDIHPGNFVWSEKDNRWIIVDLGMLPNIGREYYEFDSFEEYYDKIWLKRKETIKKIPIRSLDLSVDLKVRDKVLKYE